MTGLADFDTLDFQGIDLRYHRGGGGPPMVLLHGGGGPENGHPFVADLAKHFDVIAPVHPGFGGTETPPHFDSVDDLAYLYLDLMDAFDLDRVTLMGFSLGGWIAAEMAVKSTARLDNLILVGAVGIKIGDRESRDIADIFAPSPAALDRLIFHDPANAPDLSALADDKVEIIARNREAMALYGWEPYLHNPKLLARLHRIDVPTRLIWGAHDGIVRPGYGAAYAEAIAGAELVVIKDAGHKPEIERPDAFVAEVLSFAGGGENP